MIKKFLPENISEAAAIFADIYSNPPFSVEWITQSSAEDYFSFLMSKNDFLGFIFEENGIDTAYCFGQTQGYFRAKRFYINEIFVPSKLQRQGIGKRFIGELKKFFLRSDISAIEISTTRNSFAYRFYVSLNFHEAENAVKMIMPI